MEQTQSPTKQCSKCLQDKSLDEFNKSKWHSQGRTSKCKLCIQQYSSSRYKANREALDAKTLAWKRANPKRNAEIKRKSNEKHKDTTRAYRLKRYGMSLAEYNSLLKKQEYTCAICKRPESTRQHGMIIPLAVDHNHLTKANRGLLCRECNTDLSVIEDTERLNKCLKYLSSYEEQ